MSNQKIKNFPLPTVKQLRDAIPQHCFQRSAIQSLKHVFIDSLLGFIIGILAYKFISLEFTLLNIILWTIYAFVQGTVVMGLWVLAHQCGHGSFSTSKTLNDCVGYILHSAMLVPYFSWQRTHAVHHAKCNHMIDGETHVPNLKSEAKQINQWTYKIFGEDGFIIVQIFNHLVIGWPLYLLLHLTGSRRSPVTKQQYKSIPNHFNPFPNNELFPKQWRFRVFLSTIGCIITLAVLTYISMQVGFKTVLFMYVGPYMVINAWLVTITWLQHTDPQIPHLGADEWEWLKGATMTCDRNYPWLIDILHHKIGTTHVLHHIFPEIAFYHAQQATQAIKKLLGPHYRKDSNWIGKAIWKCASQCNYVQSLDGVQYLKSFLKQKRGQKKLM